MAAAVAPPRVALIGVGRMGLPIGERILAGGFPLAVFNRTRDRAAPLVDAGATWLSSPADALVDAEVCVTMVADDDALESLVLGGGGVVPAATPGSVLVDMSTVSVAASARVARRAADGDVSFLRAPVSGNPGVVRAGNLAIFASGPEDAFERVQPLLRAIGPRVTYVGGSEEARVVKLVLQILIGGTAELLSEALVLGESGGVDRRVLLEAVGSSAVASPFVGYKTEPLLRDDYSATFTTAMMLKDVDLVLGLADEGGLTLPLAGQLRELLDQAVAAGYADMDFMALYLQLRERLHRQTTATRDR